MDEKILDATIKRWKARTDLIWLCNNILDLTRVSKELNGEMISRMQQFQRPASLEEMVKHDKWIPGRGWDYTPLCYDETRLPGKLPDPTHFPGLKRRLLIDSRGYYKSVCNVTAHSIQWILNYPDITMLLFQGSLDLAEKFSKEIRDHFRYNERLRRLFPEYCPAKPDDWGTSDSFTMPNRTPGYIRKEPTLKATSIEKAGAGQHVEVIKYSDIVNEENSQKKERCQIIYELYQTSINLLVSPIYWVDVEGTRYHLEDVYGEIIRHEIEAQTIPRVWSVEANGRKIIFPEEQEAVQFAKEHSARVLTVDNYYQRQPEKRQYAVYLNACFRVAHPNPTFDYEDMLDPNIKFLKGPDGLRLSRSPKYYPSDILEREAKQNPEIFACQKLNNPTIANEQSKFPVNEHFPRVIKRDVFRQNVRPAYYEISVDIANTVHKNSDFTAIPVAMFDGGGRCYIVEIRHGKWQEEQIADHILELYHKYKPRRILMEQDRGNAGVKVWLQRKCQLQSIHNMPYHKVPKHTLQTKNEYIGSILRPWYITGTLVFLDDLGLAYSHMLNELKGFPKGRTDDIIDSITHFFHDKQILGRNTGRPSPSIALWQHERETARAQMWQRRLGIWDDLDETKQAEHLSDTSALTGWL